MNKIAVVILNFNGRGYLEKFLPSVTSNSAGHQIIVADNGSTDDSTTFLKEHYPLVGLIEIEENEGYSRGYNIALDQTSAEYYVLLNSDVEVSPDWLSPMLKLMESDESIAACQPKILAFHNKSHFEYAGAAGGYIDTLGYPFCRGRIFDELEEDKGQYDDTKQVFWATGACMMVRSSVYHQFGGLDNDFFAHMEEIDLCWQINNAGHKVFYCGESEVYHVGGGTLSHTSPHKTYLNFRNGLYLLLKNLSSPELWWKLPFRILLDWLAAVKFLVSGSVGLSFAVISAHFSFLKSFRTMYKKRKLSDKKTNSPKTNVIYRRFITWDYFILKKTHFSRLWF